MIEEYSFTKEGYRAVLERGEWKIGILRYSDRFSSLGELEKHVKTDEAFVLLCGSATLYTDGECREMKPLTVYNIPAGVWHHIVVSEDATVLIVEDRDTSKENTMKKYFNSQGGTVSC
jgi:mannose-6-phosphate isomerase-like protein (cupin superfamily)